MEDTPAVIDIENHPCFSHGKLGAFDEDGVSYPCVVSDGDVLHLFYTGWVATCSTGFQNQLGRAVSRDDGEHFLRTSDAPILHRTDDEPFSIGSSFVMLEDGQWRMWYTSFIEWHRNLDTSTIHRYLIRNAESKDGFLWQRDYIDRIGFEIGEHSVCHPTVLKLGDTYHMWFCARGDYYQLHHAISRNGLIWHRLHYRFPVGGAGAWDDRAQCYPSAFEYKGVVYVAYSGNDYGQGGLGILMAKTESLESAAHHYWETGHANAY